MITTVTTVARVPLIYRGNFYSSPSFTTLLTVKQSKVCSHEFYIKRPQASGIQSEDKTAAHDMGISLVYHLPCITTPHSWWTAG